MMTVRVTNSADTDRDFEVVVLERDKDGIEQISSLLQQYQDVDAVHIISHGNDGNIQLGNTSLNADTLQQNSASIALWANAFTDSGDILIYGCDLAASEIGQNLINELGALTLTDVAASSRARLRSVPTCSRRIDPLWPPPQRMTATASVKTRICRLQPME